MLQAPVDPATKMAEMLHNTHVVLDETIPAEVKPMPHQKPLPMIEQNARVIVTGDYPDKAGVIISCDFSKRIYMILGNNGKRFAANEANVQRLAPVATQNLPAIFVFDHWFDLADYQPQLSVDQTLSSLMRSNGGKIPSELISEEHLQSFAGPSYIIMADADVESSLMFPQKRYASRDFVRTTYAKFLDFCIETGWLTTDDIEIMAKEKPKSAERPVSSKVKLAKTS